MSTVSSATTLWRADKIMNVGGHSRHRQKPSPISAGFRPPNAKTTLTFAPVALAGSIARTATLRNAPQELLESWRDSALTQVEMLVEDGATFALSKNIHFLADAERTLFAARIGAGVTDLLMNTLGYAWRDNASCLASSLAPHADFIYFGGPSSGHGVALAEAHGSFAANVSLTGIGRQAQKKYRRQVKPYLASMSPHGKVIHGYSIAVGSKPDTLGAFLHVAETLVPKPKGKQPPQTQVAPVRTPDQLVPTSLALSTHRSNFSLMSAPSVARWIDWTRNEGVRPDDTSPLEFMRLPYAGRMFLACMENAGPFGGYADWIDDSWYRRWRSPRAWRSYGQHPRSEKEFAGWFVMEEKAAERFLNFLSAIVRNGIDRVDPTTELPRFDPIGFAIGGEDTRLPASEYTYALYQDGLALLGSPPRRTDGLRVWRPKDGMNGD